MKRSIETITITAADLAASAERARHVQVPSGSPMDCAPHPLFPLNVVPPMDGVDCATLNGNRRDD